MTHQHATTAESQLLRGSFDESADDRPTLKLGIECSHLSYISFIAVYGKRLQIAIFEYLDILMLQCF